MKTEEKKDVKKSKLALSKKAIMILTKNKMVYVNGGMVCGGIAVTIRATVII